MFLWKYALLFLLHSAAFLHCNALFPIRIQSTSRSNASSCPFQSKNKSLETVRNILQNHYRPCLCGGDDWIKVAHLNMTDHNQQCPSNLSLTTNPLRGCGRSSTDFLTCDTVIYSSYGHSYSSVCGTILAYQRGLAGAFHNAISYSYNTIDEAYLSGLSLTHGPAGSRQHIWSFVGAYYEEDPNFRTSVTCSCTNTNISWTQEVPSFVNNDYFCDTGNPGPGTNYHKLYTDDPLWNGEGCSETSTCCEFNTPPWFCKILQQPTTNDLELRSCYSDSSNREDKLITQIHIYIK